MTEQFVHLHVHSEYSLVDGTTRIQPLCERVRDLGMPAVALTDVANACGLIKFYRSGLDNGVKPILGVHAWISNARHPAAPFRLILLCRNDAGYRSLCELLTDSYLKTTGTLVATVDKAWLRQCGDGLIALSGGMEGECGQAILAGDTERAAASLREYGELFPERFYVELTRTDHNQEADYVAVAASLAADQGLPVVATNAVRFLESSEFAAHEIRVCINEGRLLADGRRQRRYTEQQYLRSAAQMVELFADLPEAIRNSVEIAKRCNVTLRFDQAHLPVFPLSGDETPGNKLRRDAEAGLERYLAGIPGGEAAPEPSAYPRRLKHELDVISEMGFAGYFLIVADFVQWAKQQGIPVGPGRGSGAGSLVAYALGITELDPLDHGLLFERFLNPERVSLPDFDIDFCIEGRDRVIDYVTQRYGREQVSQIITHGTMAARAVVRDVGRVLGLAYGFVDTVAKLVPFVVGMTLEVALKQEPFLRERYDAEDDVRELIDTARRLEGLTRNIGKHAGGVVIAPEELTHFTPLYFEAGMTQAVTQFDKDDLEVIGLVKFDFLGLRTLTIIAHSLRLINAELAAHEQPPVRLDAIPRDDPDAYALIRSGRTTALFQLESRGMTDLIQRLEPGNFDDLVALVALYRPGPLQSGMVDDFVNRKHGRERVSYPHPELEDILRPTYGVILYQEQVMEIARVLAGYSLGAADVLRRAMGKKKLKVMAEQRAVFIAGAAGNGVTAAVADHIFGLMEKFAEYGFNKSHSAAYALITYQTAWLKAHHTAAFMAAALSSDMDHTDKILTLLAECRTLTIEILPPDVNQCRYQFLPVDATRIRYGLGAIKGLGRAAGDSLLEVRGQDGPFADLFDLCARIDTRKINKRALEALIKSGALDGLGGHRAELLARLPDALGAVEQRERHLGQDDLFGIDAPAIVAGTVNATPRWSEQERLSAERETLGLYLSGHPVDRYRVEFDQIAPARLAVLKPRSQQAMWIAGLIVTVRTLNTQRGERIAFVTLDDGTGRIDISVFADLLAAHRGSVRKDNIVVVYGLVSVDEYTGGFQMRAEQLYDVDALRAAFVCGIRLDMTQSGLHNGSLEQIGVLMNPHRGGEGRIVIHYRRDTGEQADLRLGTGWSVQPEPSLLSALAKYVGEDNLYLEYDSRAISEVSTAIDNQRSRGRSGAERRR